MYRMGQKSALRSKPQITNYCKKLTVCRNTFKQHSILHRKTCLSGNSQVINYFKKSQPISSLLSVCPVLSFALYCICISTFVVNKRHINSTSAQTAKQLYLLCDFYPRDATGISRRRRVRPPVTCRYCIKMAKRRITQTTPRDSQGFSDVNSRWWTNPHYP